MHARSTLSARLRNTRKVNNSPAAENAKADIRRRVLAEITPEGARVFDAFAGAGVMYRAVWHEAATYVGCDTTWYRDERRVFAADNLRVLRSIDLSAFNIFDLDAHGSPWEQVLIVAARRPIRPGERLGLILTDGSGLTMKLGGYPAALRAISGLRGYPAGGSRNAQELVDRAINGLCRKMRVRVLRRWQAIGRTGAKVIYTGLVLEGLEVENP